jgi:predicted peroxiredoxin
MLTSAMHGCAGLAAMAGASALTAQEGTSGGGGSSPARYLLVGLCGSENPTRANFPFVWASALKTAGNDVRIELAGDATVLMRTPVSDSVTPVGWPPFKEALAKVVEHKIPIYV